MRTIQGGLSRLLPWTSGYSHWEVLETVHSLPQMCQLNSKEAAVLSSPTCHGPRLHVEMSMLQDLWLAL